MAKIAGYGGSVTLTGLTVGVYSWELNEDVAMLNATDFDSSGWDEFLAGIKSWTVTCQVKYDSANTIGPGDTGTFTGTVTTSKTASGSVIVASRGTSVVVDGIVTQTITLQGTGALTDSM